VSRDGTAPVLLLWRHPPYGKGRERLLLDLALSLGAFDQAVSLLFVGDGVWALLTGQDGELLGCRDLGRLWPALDLYGIDRLYVARSALAARGLDPADLALPVTVLDDSAQAELLNRHGTVLSL
jgi:tRNA 2-thiouridine synthesizing protein C